MRATRLKTIIGATVIAAGGASFIATGFAADTDSGSNAAGSAAGEKLAAGSNCSSCHAKDQKVVGPSYQQIANKFAGKPGAENTLVNAIDKGHVGTWGQVPMPAHPDLSKADTQKIVAWILTMKGGTSAEAASNGKTYTYTVDGKKVTTKFPIFKAGSKAVTPAVFTGFEQFNSYCFRCHGEDAVGGEYAPNLRRSLNDGMSKSKFVSITMTGRKAKGMPSWAGFFSPEQVDDIYQYVKARAVGAVGVGTPQQ